MSERETIEAVERSIIEGLDGREEFIRRLGKRNAAICVGDTVMSLGEYVLYRSRLARGVDADPSEVRKFAQALYDEYAPTPSQEGTK